VLLSNLVDVIADYPDIFSSLHSEFDTSIEEESTAEQ
jgi:hypothetical protein